MMRSLRQVTLLALATGTVLATGCSSAAAPAPAAYNPESGLVPKENTVLAPRSLSDDAAVKNHTVTLPKTDDYLAWAESLEIGKILAGNRGTTASTKNPNGFFGRVTKVEDAGDSIVVSLGPASTAEAFSGKVRFGAGVPSVFADAPAAPAAKAATSATSASDAEHAPGALTSQALHALDESPSGKATENKAPPVVKPLNTDVATSADGGVSVKFSNPTFDLGIGGHGEADVEFDHDGWPWDWSIDANGSVEVFFRPSASIELEATLKKGASTKVSLELAAPPKVTFEAGIPFTFELTPTLECEASAEGEVVLKGTIGAKGDFTTGFKFDTSSSDGTKLINASTVTAGVTNASATASVTASITCSVSVGLGIYAFDAAGAKSSLTLSGEVHAKACATTGSDGAPAGTGINVYGGSKLTADINAIVKVPVIDVEVFNKNLVSKDLWSTGFGDENTCSCAAAEKTGDGPAPVCLVAKSDVSLSDH